MTRPTMRACFLIASAVSAGFAGALGLLDACGAQADRHYQGEPLATIHGSVIAQSATAQAPPDVEAAVLWTHYSSTGYRPALVGTTVSATGSFPASFTFNMFEPPPADAEWRIGVEVSSSNGLPAGASGAPAGV